MRIAHNSVGRITDRPDMTSAVDRGGKALLNNNITRKPVFMVSDQVRHKQSCAATEDG